MQPWYLVVNPRKEVREGRSFDPSEFAIALEQIVAGTAPPDYLEPEQFFKRTVFTQLLNEHASMVLRRLAGETADTSPVLTLVTQFGGGKTHTLTVLYHLARAGADAAKLPGIGDLLAKARLKEVPHAKVAVFVGNAWDPQEGAETPWIDVARQLAGEEGVKALGADAKSVSPGTGSLRRLFEVAGGSVLLLFDEVLNYFSRNRENKQPEALRNFLGNLVRATTGMKGCAAVVSLPQSKPEMDDYENEWHERITKEVGRVARQLIVNDEAEVSEVVRRRLFEDLGGERLRRNVSKTFADWCFERRAQLPAEWMAVDTSLTEKKAKEFLRDRFERCYPFHPATLSVFLRKWRTVSQYQQTRGTLAMLAHWVSRAYNEAFTARREEPLITLGSAPLALSDFRSLVLGQLGEPRLTAALDTDVAGKHSHARALDADTKGPLRDIHRRVGAAILFESSGGQTDKLAHLPELRFALGEPGIDTTSVDNAAAALETKGFYVRRVGTDGYRMAFKPKLNKVVSDRRASLDEDTEIRPTVREIVQGEFEKGASIPVSRFPADSSSIPDSPRLTLVVADPEWEWEDEGRIRDRIATWTRKRGSGDRLYPGALVWCVRRPGRELRNKVETMLAWNRVQREIRDGTIGGDFDKTEVSDVRSNVADAKEAARDEVWGEYRYAVLADRDAPDGIREIDLGAGHSSSTQTLCGRVLESMKTENLLNESVGAGYVDRNWPPALEKSGVWPLQGLRKAFLDGSLTRLVDPDDILRKKIVEFVSKGEMGLASGQESDGTFKRLWFEEDITSDEVAFESDVFLVRKKRAKELRQPPVEPPVPPGPQPPPGTPPTPPGPQPPPGVPPTLPPAGEKERVTVSGIVPPEAWNRVGTRVISKLRQGEGIVLGVNLSAMLDAAQAKHVAGDLRQAIDDLALEDTLRVNEGDSGEDTE